MYVLRIFTATSGSRCWKGRLNIFYYKCVLFAPSVDGEEGATVGISYGVQTSYYEYRRTSNATGQALSDLYIARPVRCSMSPTPGCIGDTGLCTVLYTGNTMRAERREEEGVSVCYTPLEPGGYLKAAAAANYTGRAFPPPASQPVKNLTIAKPQTLPQPTPIGQRPVARRGPLTASSPSSDHCRRQSDHRQRHHHALGRVKRVSHRRVAPSQRPRSPATRCGRDNPPLHYQRGLSHPQTS